jgi:uncharacterized protein (TIGR03437 family)
MRSRAAIVPFAAGSHDSTIVQGVTSAPVALPVAANTPAIFTVGSSGKGQAAILNQDYSTNSASIPADRGSTVMIYATGAGGAMAQAAIDGRIATAPLATLLQATTVRIGGMIAPVIYAGAAPGLVNGILQIKCDGARRGDTR